MSVLLLMWKGTEFWWKEYGRFGAGEKAPYRLLVWWQPNWHFVFCPDLTGRDEWGICVDEVYV